VANVAGGTITVQTSSNAAANAITNSNVLQAINGGTLSPRGSSNVTKTGAITRGNGTRASGVKFNTNRGNTRAPITTAHAASRINQSSITIIGGTISNTAGGTFAPNTGSSNFLDGVTFAGTLDLTGSGTIERVTNGLTLNGTVNISNNSVFSFQGT